MINLSKIIAVVLVLIAIALGVYAWMLGRKPAVAVPTASASSSATPKTETFPVVFTTKAVQAGQPIPADALRVQQLPVNPPSAIRDIQAATGRIPVFDMAADTPLLENQLSSGLAIRLQEGERAVAIKADEVMGVGNKIRPGDFVDVFFMLKSDNKEIEQGQGRLLLARKRVLAFGNASVDGMPSAEGQAAQGQQRAEAARTAVLAVPVEDINRLAISDQMGRLLLALRNPSDTAVPDPALFPELPSAIVPTRTTKAGATKTAPTALAELAPVDRASAGLTVMDLATGGEKSNRTTPQPAAAPVRAMQVRQPGKASPPRSGNEVEVIKGDKREMLSY